MHLYWVAETQELWSHSDLTGTFYIINLANTAVINSTVPVRACVRPGHV